MQNNFGFRFKFKFGFINLLLFLQNIKYGYAFNYPYNLLGEWSISYQNPITYINDIDNLNDDNLNDKYNFNKKYNRNINLESYIKIYPSKIQISTRKDYAGGIITFQKEFYGSYNLYSQLDDKKSKIDIHLEKQIDIIKSILGINLGGKINVKEVQSPIEIEVLSISNTVIVLLITGYIYKYKFIKEEVLLMRLCQNKNNYSKPINIILISNLIGYIITHLYDGLLDFIEKHFPHI